MAVTVGKMLIPYAEDMKPCRTCDPVGWETGVATHPCTVDQVVLGARRVSDGAEFILEVSMIDIIRPFTDEEVRAILLHRWQQQEPELPEGIALVTAQLAVQRWRS